jgi:hypothetical protein
MRVASRPRLVKNGGHSAASDAPDLLVDDLRTLFRRFR